MRVNEMELQFGHYERKKKQIILILIKSHLTIYLCFVFFTINFNLISDGLAFASIHENWKYMLMVRG